MSQCNLSSFLSFCLALVLTAVPFATDLAAANYKISTGHAEATLELETMSVDVSHRAAGVNWKMSRAGGKELVYEQDGKIHEVSLADAKIKTVTRLGKGALMVLMEDFRLELLVYFEQDSGELVFKLSAREEDHNFRIKGVIYPRPFEVPVRSDSYSFFGISQGVLIPGDWQEQENMLNPIQLDDQQRFKLFGELMDRPFHWWDHQEWDQAGLIYAERMACFGAHQPGSGWLAYIDDGCRMDNFLHVRHQPGSHTDYKVYWRPSMGSLSYPRIIRYHFQKDAGYAELARHYRAYYKKLGYLKTLNEKSKNNQNVEQLKGAVNLRARVSRKDHRTFKFEIYNTFKEIGAQVDEFRKVTGAERASVSFTGWQRYGHDQEYPDIIPPNMYAGGPYGLDSLARRVKAMGYLFGLATDNYCDITLDSPSFREEVTLKDSQGRFVRRSTWGAGVNSLICPRWAIRFLRRNWEVGRTDYPFVRGLLDTARPQLYLLGNYVCNWECYDKLHPLTRNENREALGDIFEYFNEQKVLLTIEHHNDWVVPWVVSARTREAHDGVYGLDRAGRTNGIPIPLWQLCFHDCTYVNAGNFLWGALTGALSGYSLPVREGSNRLKQSLLLAKLHRQVGWDDMTGHRFLSDDYKIQESTFSSGARVWINYNTGEYKISGVQGIEDQTMKMD
jgi:hypothetical protein